MTTVLKARRTGEDLRNHPDVLAQTKAPKVRANEMVISGDRIVRIESFKKSEYDRGTWKVYVDGVQWGSIATQWHGCHGTTYHLSDLHGQCGYTAQTKFRGTGAHRFIEIQARCESAQWIRMQNIGLPEDQRVKPRQASQVMLEMCRDAIADGHFRAPDTRESEIEAARVRAEQSIQEHDAAKDREFGDKAREVLAGLNHYIQLDNPDTDTSADVALIVDAMKWAQTK